MICGVTFGLADEALVAQAQVQVPLFTEGDGVEQIECLVAQRGFAIAQRGLVMRAAPVTRRIAQVIAIGGVERVAQAVIVGFQVERFA
ncbi:hypothetical protein D3C71_2003150 [compost metagenome]